MRIAALFAGSAVLALAASAQAQPASDRYPPSAYDRGYPNRNESDPRMTTRYADPTYEPAPVRGGPADGRGDDRDDADRGGDGGSGDVDLARELNLRGAQLTALETYRAAFRPDEAATRRAQETAGRLPSMTTPQRLDFTRSEMDRERADFDRTDAATRRFYAELSPDQRRSFDRLTAPQPAPGGGPDGPFPSPQPAPR